MRNLPNIYTSFCPGAPILNGTPGSLLDIYRACLVNGTSKVTFTNIVVSNGVATIQSVVPKQVYFNGSRISIEGCDEPLLNIVTEVSEHTTNSFSFKTTVADGTYGGNIRIQQPGAGWQVLYSGTNEAVFVSGNLDTLGVCVKIIDNSALSASFELYETMSSISVGINKADPTMFDANRIIVIRKAYQANATSVCWWLAADNSSVHFSNDRIDSGTITLPIESFTGGYITSFGSYSAFNEADKRNFYMCGPIAYTTSSTTQYHSTLGGGLGYYNNTTPTDSYNNGLILFDSQRNTKGWLKAYVCPPIFPFTNSVMNSGGNKGFKMSYRLRPTMLFTDHYLVAYGPNRGTLQDPIIQGKVLEVKFSNQQLYGIIRNFSSDTVDGKRYIFLPIYNSYALRSQSTISNDLAGMVAILIGEKWGD